MLSYDILKLKEFVSNGDNYQQLKLTYAAKKFFHKTLI
jgi:hypothetical protein